MRTIDDIKKILAQLTPYPLPSNIARLSADVQAALPHLAAALRGMDDLFHHQMGPAVVAVFDELAADDTSPQATALRVFNSPYAKLADGDCFVEGVTPALPQRALYPADISEAELDAYIAAHPDAREALLSPTTVVVRAGSQLNAIPYHDYFADLLAPVAAHLRRAADLIAHGGTRAFLHTRADALQGIATLRASDAQWVQLTDGPLEIVIGPFEVYEDGLKGVKAFYEGMLLQIDHEAGARLATIEASLAELATLVPVPAGSRGAMGGMAPMVVADELLATGEGYAGLLASAFNLPNDPWVRQEVGWKQVMVRNVMQAKFDTCTRAICERVLTPGQAARLSFDAYFFFVLLHEVCHGLGPAYRSDGRSTNEACGRHYTPLEEAKADIGALVILMAKAGSCGLPAVSREEIAVSYLAGLYRSARFGLHEAHGMANVIEFRYLLEAGALAVGAGDGRVVIDVAGVAAAAAALLAELTRLQAVATPGEIEDFLAHHGVPPPELEAAMGALVDVPVDIRPIFPL